MKKFTTKKEIIGGKEVIIKVFAASLAKPTPQMRTYRERNPQPDETQYAEEEVDMSLLPPELRAKLGI